ncbi:LysR family transcriptional regulator [Glycomyces terrestris]|uniref:LysR family transcriptional regulator n=1 Tax=Glycomyces terrestris TaxID=2493553 RepID=A0A426UTF9_9ACTN|nr:LysR family transcriptional regulator [Glycomyces terrestris]RRR97275.1 LysR family transcriptional regulator [Glycomyces terrestris]
MNLEMREIEAFLTVAEELHFGRAGERLALSTSRVSALIRTLERRAGAALFERTSRNVRLTRAGEHLFAEFRAAYVRIERALADVRDAADPAGKVIRVGFATTLPEKVPGALVQAFEQAYPQARVVQYAAPTTDLFRWLEGDRPSWQVDVFATWMPVEDSPEADLAIGPVLQRVRRAVMLGVQHPLAERAVVDVEDLADHEVVYPQLPGWYGAAWTPQTTPGGRELRLRRVNAEYIEDVLRLVAEQQLAHLTFASLLDSYHRPGVVVLPLIGLPPMPIRLVWPRSSRNLLVQAFADVASDCARQAGWQT